MSNPAPPPAHLNFQAHREEFRDLNLPERFERIARTNLWGAESSRSGLGSQFDATAGLRAALPAFLKRHGVCVASSTFRAATSAWLSTIDLRIPYIGADIVEALPRENEKRFGGPQSNRRFVHLDLTRDPLPRADAVLCRDCLVHLSFEHIFRAMNRIATAAALVTSYLLDDDLPRARAEREHRGRRLADAEPATSALRLRLPGRRPDRRLCRG